MDKKKLEDAYFPDKASRKERIVVALSGGIDSYVAAYLLKIQKYELFAVTVAVGWEQYTGDKSAALSCYLDEPKLNSIRDFCHQLNIPHYTIRAQSEFQETAVEKWMAAKATGILHNACWSCHDLRMQLIHQKMLELDVKYLATGHYAKIFHNETHGSFYVHSSNDEENDQSALLSRLPHAILSALKLPLSDLQKREVLKLAENFGLSFEDKKIKMHACFPEDPIALEYLAKRIPAKFQGGGEVANAEGTEGYGEHEGILHHVLGGAVNIVGSPKGDKLFLSKFAFKERKIIVEESEFFKRKNVLLVECRISEETPWIEPIKGAIRLNETDTVECWIFPKSLDCAYVEWESETPVLEGKVVPLFRKKGKNSKVLLTGKVRYLHKEEEVEIEDTDQDGKKKVKVDHTRDF